MFYAFQREGEIENLTVVFYRSFHKNALNFNAKVNIKYGSIRQ